MKLYSVLISVLKQGKASKALKCLKEVGVTGGTIVLAKGTADNEVLKFLEYTSIKKEVLLSVISSENEDLALNHLNERLKLEKASSGIAFTIPLTDVVGSKSKLNKAEREESLDMSYEVIFVVVDNHQGEKVVELSQKYGSKGATIIHGRGSGVHEKASIFNITIEPEKEIVMLLVKSDIHEEVIIGLSKDLNIKDPGKGIIFSANVNKAIGLVD